MNKRTRIVATSAAALFIAVAFIVWFLLGDPAEPPAEPSAEPSAEPPAGSDLTGPCRGDVYRMVYQYDASGRCVPTGCESGYTEIGGQCVYDGTDTTNLVNETHWGRAGRVGWRLGKMRF